VLDQPHTLTGTSSGIAVAQPFAFRSELKRDHGQYAAMERELLVERAERPAADIVAITIVDPDGAPLPSWTPGAHVDVLLDNGLERQYSLCGDVENSFEWRIAVALAPASRGGSAFIHDTVRPGARMRARNPRNNFVLEPSPRYQFIAGGIGITPILPMVRAAQSAGAEWNLLYGGRSRATMAFLDELAEVDHGRHVVARPQDEYGLLDVAAAIAALPETTVVYCCGPEPLLEVVEETCEQLGVALHVERFTPKEPIDHDAATDAPFEVFCEKSQVTLLVPGGQSILATAEAAGVKTLSSCREGTCGTCETTVLHGTPDHRDSFLSEDERADNETMMICVSRAKPGERLVLDL